MNSLEEKYKTLFGAYLGMQLMDEYDLKVYKLNEIENYIKDYIKEYPIKDFDYYEFMKQVDKEESDIVKLQDALRLARILEYPNDLEYLIKNKIKELRNEEN